MRLPFRSIKIGAHKWKVKLGKLDLIHHVRKIAKYEKYGLEYLYFGDASWYNQTIRLNKDLPKEVAGEVLLHELFHVIMDEVGLHSYLKKEGDAVELEESLVQNISQTLLTVFRDNPKVVEFILNKDGK